MENYAEHYELWDDEQYLKCLVKISSRHLNLNDLFRNHFTGDEIKPDASIKISIKDIVPEPNK